MDFKIAVFVRFEREFNEMKLLPKENFIQIRKQDDLFGKRFDGVILGYNWHQRSFDIRGAMEDFEHRHPELFIDKVK